MRSETADGQAPGRVRQQSSERITRARAYRPLNVGLHERGEHGVVAGRVRRADRLSRDQVCAIDGTFETRDEVVELMIVSDVAAEDHALRVLIKGARTDHARGRG